MLHLSVFQTKPIDNKSIIQSALKLALWKLDLWDTLFPLCRDRIVLYVIQHLLFLSAVF